MKKKEQYAFIIPGPADYLTLKIKHSANAWWMDAPKLYRFITHLDNMMSIKDACNIAGITTRQYKYFKKLHPLIQDRINYPHAKISMAAKINWVKAIYAGDTRACVKWLERTEPEIYSKRKRRTPMADLRRRYGLPTGNGQGYPLHDKEYAYKLREDFEKLKKDLQDTTD